MEWDYSGRKGRDGQKKKIGKANERKRKVKRGIDEEVNGQGGKEGCPESKVPLYLSILRQNMTNNLAANHRTLN